MHKIASKSRVARNQRRHFVPHVGVSWVHPLSARGFNTLVAMQQVAKACLETIHSTEQQSTHLQTWKALHKRKANKTGLEPLNKTIWQQKVS